MPDASTLEGLADEDWDAGRAEQFGIAFRAEQARNYGCGGEIECCFPMDGNCACFNVTLARALASIAREGGSDE